MKIKLSTLLVVGGLVWFIWIRPKKSPQIEGGDNPSYLAVVQGDGSSTEWA